MDLQDIKGVVTKHASHPGGIISTLEAIQARYSYLPREALIKVAELTGRPLIDIYGVATFYKSFSLKPRGKHLISVCLGTACHVRNAPAIAKEFERQLAISAGQTTPDKLFTLETVNCLGACALGPIVVIDGRYFSKVSQSRVKNILDQARQGLDSVEIKNDQRIFPVEVRCPRCNHSLMDPKHLIDGHPSIRVTISFERNHGWLLLSSLYGSYTTACEHVIPMNTILNLFCPHCHAEIISASNCPSCGAPMVPMIVEAGGMVQICSRYGCKSHMLDLNGENF